MSLYPSELNQLQTSAALNRLSVLIDAFGTGGTSLTLGGYTIFVDVDGSLKIKTPDNTMVTLVVKT